MGNNTPQTQHYMQKHENERGNGASGDPDVMQVSVARRQCGQPEEAFAGHPRSSPSAESAEGGRAHILGIPGTHGQELGMPLPGALRF